MEDIVIFGASGGAIKVAQTLQSLNIDFKYFVDNDPEKWGDLLLNKKINNPLELINDSCEIIIASIYQEEIEEQLKNMRIDFKRIVPKEKWILDYFVTNVNYFAEKLHLNGNTLNNDKMVFLDLEQGMGTGGIESWCFYFAKIMLNKGYKCEIISKITDDIPPKDLEKNVIQIDIRYDDYVGSVERILNRMYRNLPCTVVANWMTQNFMAAVVLKKLFPDKIKIVAGLHHDMLGYYRRNAFIQDYVDVFMCVGSGIKKRMIEEFNVPQEKVYYAPFPLKVMSEISETVLNKDRPICVGYAARLVKAQKRADYIIPLISKLQSYGVNYRLKIAGDGKYYDKILNYINENDINNIELKGKLQYEQMDEFWHDTDIVINLSDSEGMGLSILEAMALGAVPVVTNTAGIDEFANDNGFIVGFGQIDEMAKIIKKLDDNRKKLYDLKKQTIKKMNSKCNVNDYISIL